jgi:hypothetical protein
MRLHTMAAAVAALFFVSASPLQAQRGRPGRPPVHRPPPRPYRPPPRGPGIGAGIVGGIIAGAVVGSIVASTAQPAPVYVQAPRPTPRPRPHLGPRLLRLQRRLHLDPRPLGSSPPPLLDMGPRRLGPRRRPLPLDAGPLAVNRHSPRTPRALLGSLAVPIVSAVWTPPRSWRAREPAAPRAVVQHHVGTRLCQNPPRRPLEPPVALYVVERCRNASRSAAVRRCG